MYYALVLFPYTVFFFKFLSYALKKMNNLIMHRLFLFYRVKAHLVSLQFNSIFVKVQLFYRYTINILENINAQRVYLLYRSVHMFNVPFVGSYEYYISYIYLLYLSYMDFSTPMFQ